MITPRHGTTDMTLESNLRLTSGGVENGGKGRVVVSGEPVHIVVRARGLSSAWSSMYIDPSIRFVWHGTHQEAPSSLGSRGSSLVFRWIERVDRSPLFLSVFTFG